MNQLAEIEKHILGASIAKKKPMEDSANEYKNKITIMNLNIQSGAKKYVQLEHLLAERKVDIVCLNEHWMGAEQLKAYHVQHYVIGAFHCRTDRRGGGVLTLVRDNYHVVAMDEINLMSVDVHAEIAFVRIEMINTIIGSVYRSLHGDIDVFKETMYNGLSIATTKFHKSRVCLAGDFNIDFSQKSRIKTDILELFSAFGLENIFTESSRIGASSATCIDNVFVSDIDKDSNQLTIETHISDHLGFVSDIDKDSNQLTIETHISDHLGQIITMHIPRRIPENGVDMVLAVRNISDLQTYLFFKYVA
ncbi:hypothetical protein QE152_g10318 [Popillia japonica]|uniref:Endonuclease/exonuclease/phosphatase domain-containing protein n=1 Tax=Popillia japonica TaxID=7064 RepID=A0AAW1LV38_POPJA